MSKSTKIIAALGVVAGLGVAAMPLASYAATEGDVVINAHIAQTLEITAGTPVELSGILNGGDPVEGTSAIKVITNDTKGYVVSIRDKDGTTALTSSAGDSIAAGVPVNGNSAWGWKGGDVQEYTAITDTNVAVKTTTEATTTEGDSFNITFGVTADSSQEAGDYTDTVVVSVAANPGA